jgi:acetylornithine deacetylase
MDVLDETIGLLGELIAYPTVSTDSNLALIAWASDQLGALGADVRISADPTGTKANLFATIGPEGDGGIVLSGHSDVVPAEGQDWASDPFTMAERNGNIYGRGACDMKGFIAAVLCMAPRFAARRLSRPLHIALTYDEETGCFGARALVEELRNDRIRPAAAIIGEPTSMRIVEGHKGCFEYTTEFTGLDGHGSSPDKGVNAIGYAVRYATRLMELSEELKTRAPGNNRFEPPWTTVNLGRIAGGDAHNVIAGHCRLDWEMRPIQGSDADLVCEAIDAYAQTELEPAMQAVSADAGIIRHVIGEIAGLEPVDDNEALRIVAALTGAQGAELVPFGTEAGLFQALGMTCVVCGPGSIDQAHKPDEFVSREQLSACLQMLAGLEQQLAA